MKTRFTQWPVSEPLTHHPAAEPKKKSALKRRKLERTYPPSPSPDSNNLRGRNDAGGLRYTPAP
ncbi:hypothetical protein [Flaviaesturariibacter amylovorans]|uniref:hypothetical protein n=1 Tax=Flaviaesturariibacter amylovorans TaxID=1084520 RepID=UPI0031F07E29